MANSEDVTAGDDILASQYNNLREDVLDTSTGHVHDGVNAKSNVDNSTIEISGGNYQIKDGGVSVSQLEDDCVVKSKLHSGIITYGLLQEADGSLSAKVDDSSIEVNGSNEISIKDGGVGANALSSAVTLNSAVTRYEVFSGSVFIPTRESYTWDLVNGAIKSGDTGQLIAIKCIKLPYNAIITSFEAYWYRDDASASGSIDLVSYSLALGNLTVHASADSDSTAGNHSVEDTSITSASVGSSVGYCALLTLTPNDSQDDVYLRGVKIEFTTLYPFP